MAINGNQWQSKSIELGEVNGNQSQSKSINGNHLIQLAEELTKARRTCQIENGWVAQGGASSRGIISSACSEREGIIGGGGIRTK